MRQDQSQIVYGTQDDFLGRVEFLGSDDDCVEGGDSICDDTVSIFGFSCILVCPTAFSHQISCHDFRI